MNFVLKSKHWMKVLTVFATLFVVAGCISTAEVKPQVVVMNTTLGEVEIELYQDKAPITVNNFLRYVDAGAYQKGDIYRVVRHDNDNGSPKITVIQGGANRAFKDWPAIDLETTEMTGIKHTNGVISMARADPKSATTAFFICIGEQPGLDFGGKRAKDGLGFAAFGKVVKGMDVIIAINQIRKTQQTNNAYMKGQMLLEPVIINNVSRK